MLKLTPHSIVQRVDNEVAEAEFDNSIVLLHVENGKYYDFNNTSADLWSYLKLPLTVKDLCHKLVQKYDCTFEQCYPDVIDFLNKLDEHNLLSLDIDRG